MQRFEQLLYCGSCSQTRRTIQWRRPRWESRLVCSRTAGAAAASFVLQAHAQGRAQAQPEVPARDNRRRGREQEGEGLGGRGGKWGGVGGRGIKVVGPNGWEEGRVGDLGGARVAAAPAKGGHHRRIMQDHRRIMQALAQAQVYAQTRTRSSTSSHQPERISHGIERHRRRVTGGTRGRGSGWTFSHTITIQCDRSSP